MPASVQLLNIAVALSITELIVFTTMLLPAVKTLYEDKHKVLIHKAAVKIAEGRLINKLDIVLCPCRFTEATRFAVF